MTSNKFELKWSAPSQNVPVQWWYLGTDKYYHYIAERWGTSRRSWKVPSLDLILKDVELHYPKGDGDNKVGVLLKQQNLPF